MSNLDYVKLDEAEIQSRLEVLKGWAVKDGLLTKTFPMQTYLDAFPFAAEVGEVAEHLNHHPDILVGYRKVTVSVNTHDVGGISPYDFELARQIDLI